MPAQAIVGQWLASFKEFPIRQKPAAFNLDEVMQKLESSGKGNDCPPPMPDPGALIH